MNSSKKERISKFTDFRLSRAQKSLITYSLVLNLLSFAVPTNYKHKTLEKNTLNPTENEKIDKFKTYSTLAVKPKIGTY